jgi:hypothetical protein
MAAGGKLCAWLPAQPGFGPGGIALWPDFGVTPPPLEDVLNAGDPVRGGQRGKRTYMAHAW